MADSGSEEYTDPLKMSDSMAINSPLYGDYDRDGQMRKLYIAAFGSAISFLLLLGLFPLVMRGPPGQREDAIASSSNSGLPRAQLLLQESFGEQVRKSLDKTVSPCDDFYKYVCGSWSSIHPSLAHQFNFLENRMKVTVVRKLPHRAGRFSGYPAVEKVAQALSMCLKEHYDGHDHENQILKLLASVDLDWPKLNRVSSGLPSFDFIRILLALSLEFGIPVFFKLTADVDLRSANTTVLAVHPGWVQEFVRDGDVFHCSTIASLYGRRDLEGRLVEVHNRVTALMSLLHRGIHNKYPMYIQVGDLSDIDETLPRSEVLVDMLNLHFPQGSKLNASDDVYLAVGGRASWRLAAMFATEFGRPEDVSAAAAYVCVVVLWKLAVASSARLTGALKLSKYDCFRYLEELAPHAMAMLLAGEYVSSEDIEAADTMVKHIQSTLASSFRELPAEELNESLHRLYNMGTIIGVPAALYKPEELEHHYSFLPAFYNPFVASLLESYRRRVGNEKSSLKRPASKKDARDTMDRLPLTRTRPSYVPYMHMFVVPAPALASPLFIRESLTVAYASLGHLVGRELSLAFDLKNGTAGPGGVHKSWHGSEGRRRLQLGLDCLYQRNFTKDTGVDMEEFHADILGLKLALRALESTGHGPVNASSVDTLRGWTEEQTFFVSSCYKWCARPEFQTGGSEHAQFDEQCNEPLRHEERFFRAFNCSEHSLMRKYGKHCVLRR